MIEFKPVVNPPSLSTFATPLPSDAIPIRRAPRSQTFHIIRASQEAGACGASLCLSAAVSQCLSCGVLDSPTILGCLRSLSLAVDEALSSTARPLGERPSSRRGTAVTDAPDRGHKKTETPAPPQDACLGLASLAVACEGHVLLPPGFADSVFDKLRKAVGHRRGGDNGIRVVSLLALGSLIGGQILGAGEFRPRQASADPPLQSDSGCRGKNQCPGFRFGIFSQYARAGSGLGDPLLT